ncbi:hypothetical protein LINPERHAP1_LOCUS21420 [Linum perenne]
MRWKESSR